MIGLAMRKWTESRITTRLMMAIFAAAILIWAAVYLAAIQGSGSDSTVAKDIILGGLACAAAAIVLGVTARNSMVGVYVGERGLIIREALRTRTFLWEQIEAIEGRPGRVLGGDSGRMSVWLTLRSGDQVETPIQRRGDGGLPQRGRTFLTPDEFDEALQELRSHLI